MAKIFMLMVFIFSTKDSIADIFHYNNILVGERAMGLGGAFTAVSDDASGIVYNPAGIAFAISNDVSGSANAYYRRKVLYKKTIGQDDFTEESRGSAAPFFGGLQKLDHIVNGLALAFGVFTIDSDLKNQNDFISNDTYSLERFHRTANIRAESRGAGIALAMRVLPGFSVGVGVSGINLDELVQEYQHTTYSDGRYLTQNIRNHLQVNGTEYSLGTQVAWGQFSFGLNFKYRTILNESFDSGYDRTVNYDTLAGTSLLLPVPMQTFVNVPVTKPLGVLPWEGKFGVAWFASARLLWTLDAGYVSEAKEGQSQYDRNEVTNFASGLEYYITPSVPVRIGLFTNNDTRPDVVENKTGQADHIDYIGTSLFFAWVQPNSQISLGSVYQVGDGKAQKTADPTIQEVEAESITFAFSATHSF